MFLIEIKPMSYREIVNLNEVVDDCKDILKQEAEGDNKFVVISPIPKVLDSNGQIETTMQEIFRFTGSISLMNTFNFVVKSKCLQPFYAKEEN